jgi:predicted dehydrogenase
MATTTPPESEVKVAVVGLGFMGVTHLKSYLSVPGARVVAVCDAVRQPVNGVLSASGNVGSGDEVRLDMSVVKAHRDLQPVLDDPAVDLVDLCVPTHLHHPLALAALRAGKHVICEKPLARTAVQAREIVAVARESRGFFMPAMCMRFWPDWVWVKRAIDDRTYGAVLAARFRRVAEAPGWGRENYFKGAQSGGALLDLHIHDTDFVQFCFGRPLAVFSSGSTKYSGAVDHVITQYLLPSGLPVHAEASWIMSSGHGFNMCYTFNFERATVDYDLTRGTDALKVFEDGQPPRVVRNDGPDGYVGELRHMIESVLAGRPPTVVTAQDGLSAVEICEAEEKSVHLRQPVVL